MCRRPRLHPRLCTSWPSGSASRDARAAHRARARACSRAAAALAPDLAAAAENIAGNPAAAAAPAPALARVPAIPIEHTFGDGPQCCRHEYAHAGEVVAATWSHSTVRLTAEGLLPPRRCNRIPRPLLRICGRLPGCCYGTHLHTVLVHGTLEALFFKKRVVYTKVMCLTPVNPPAVNQLRDVNTNFRIDLSLIHI